jgi:hypothetical protein
MDAGERRLFEQAVQRATGSHTGPELDAALVELGWRDALDQDPRTAIAVLFEQLGATNATASALDDVVRAALGLDDDAPVVLPAVGEWDPPGGVEGTEAGLCVNGLMRRGPEEAKTVTLVAEAGDGEHAVTVSPGSLTLRPVHGMDPGLGLVAVAGETHDLADDRTLAPGRWTCAVDRARLSLAHELVGASSSMLDLARTHALDRVQFGRPIGSFQAVRHRLADTHVALEGTRALLDVAWEDGMSQTAALAKAVAGRSARLAARHCQQVLAGIGFTTEHPLHRYVRRVLVLDELFGSSRVLTRELGQRLAAGGALPPPIAL